MSKLEPPIRPRAANRCLVYPASNCCWQIATFAWSLAVTHVAVHQATDDYTPRTASARNQTGVRQRDPATFQPRVPGHGCAQFRGVHSQPHERPTPRQPDSEPDQHDPHTGARAAVPDGF